MPTDLTCPFLPSWMSIILPILIIWSLIWKGIALWKAGRNNQLAWFIVLLIFNTLGILEIIYIFYFGRKKEDA
jgi:hypothetical protein